MVDICDTDTCKCEGRMTVKRFLIRVLLQRAVGCWIRSHGIRSHYMPGFEVKGRSRRNVRHCEKPESIASKAELRLVGFKSV